MRWRSKAFAALLTGFGLLLVSGCSTDASTSGQSDATHQPTPSPAFSFVAFGDSWPYGAHCGGCVPFPQLIADHLEGEVDGGIDFNNFTTNGGTTADLLRMIQEDPSAREAVAAAELIVISTGANDMEDAFNSWSPTRSCGGSDGLDCFRVVAEGWRSGFEAILSEINAIHTNNPVAIRVLTNSNEFLADPGLIAAFGADFGATGGAAITALHHDALCEAAEAHGALCIDLRPVLNGPALTTPQDVNTQAAMQAVADAVLAAGLTPGYGR